MQRGKNGSPSRRSFYSPIVTLTEFITKQKVFCEQKFISNSFFRHPTPFGSLQFQDTTMDVRLSFRLLL